MAALAVTVLVWPVAAIVRRRYGAKLALDRRALRAFRLSRIAAIAVIVALASWLGAFAMLTLDGNTASDAYDPIFWLVEIVATVGFIGGLVLMLWNLWVVWTGNRRWPAKAWSIVLAVSALTMLWVGLAFHLVGFGVNY